MDLHPEANPSDGRRTGLERALRDPVREGRPAPGTPLPATRRLADESGVSRGTLKAAYDQLVAEGCLTARQGAGAVLQVVAEMGQSAGSWQLSFELAPADRVGEYQGFFGTGVAVARTAGPLVLTALLLGGVTPVASYAMGPAAREGAAGPVSAGFRRPVSVS